ncbi:MAG: arginine--tRNA ligase, partial [Candidatus Hydrothermarchaeales archaeon]
MFWEFKTQARKTLKEALKAEGIEHEIKFEEPMGEFGDISTPICFELAPKLKKPPEKFAEELVKRMDIPKESFIEEVKAINGHINFYLDYDKFSYALIGEVKERGSDYGRGRKTDKIVLEHASANPNGPLHIGHGRNAIIGDTLCRVLRFSGYKVETQYYVNDMGKQLAKVVWGLRRFQSKKKKADHKIAEIYYEANKAIEENPEFEREISQLMKGYEAGEKGVTKEFEDAVNYCLEGIKETLDRLGIKHDSFIWESRFARDGSVDAVLKRLTDTKHAKRDDVLYLDLRDFGIEKEMVLTREDGTTLYPARDIAYHLWKKDQGRVIDIWGADHKLAASQLGAVMKILGEDTPEFIIHEFISLPAGSMSTRRGVFISVDDLIDESISRAYREVDKRRKDETREFKEKVAKSVGIGAVRFNIIKVAPEKSMVFRWEEALDFERQGSPFIQYAFARACRILEKVKTPDKFKPLKLTDFEKDLIKTISKFPLIVEEAAETRKPYLLALYAMELSNAFHRFYMYNRVLGTKEEDFRVNLVMATKITLENVLILLGLDALEAM